MSEDEFEKMFSEYGKITSRKIMMVADESGKESSKGFGFVAFETNEAAVAAVEALNGKKLGEKELYVGRAQKKKVERLNQLRREYELRRQENQARYKGVNLYVKNLDDAITDEQLRKRFEEFGSITSATGTEQKQMLGERLFPLIAKPYPDLAGKITGMLLEMDNSELLHLLEDQNALNVKVEEAVKVLQEHARSTGNPISSLDENK